MKKIISILLLATILLAFSSCGCKHEWADATCKTPKTCMSCGKTTGTIEPYHHQWKDATCVAPKICSLCGQTEGVALTTHKFVNDECELCGAIQLTLSNYEKYLTIDATVSANSMYYSSLHSNVYHSVDCQFQTTGDSHYKYENVSFVIRFEHYDKEGRQQKFKNDLAILTGNPITDEAIPYSEAKRTMNLNLSGNGIVTCVLYTPWSEEKAAYSDIQTVYSRTYYEVISVTGIVKEYN